MTQKIDRLFDKLKYAAKVNVVLGFVLKKVENGTCRFYYAHKNNTFIERSKLVLTKQDLVEIKNALNNTDVIQACTKKRANAKWKHFNFENVTGFATLVGKIPFSCKDAAQPEPVREILTINCLNYAENTRQQYNDNFCLFRVLA